MNDACRDLPGEPSESYVVAHDARTGREVWKTSRVSEAEAEFADGYTTPLLWNPDGRQEVIIMGGEILDAYDPATGERLWYLPRVVGNRPVTGPVTWGDRVYATQGKRGPFFAFRPKRQGEESHDSILWKHERGTPDSPCPVVTEGMVFWVNDDGIAYCLDALTGEEYWRTRLEKGPYRASPIVADGNVYFTGTRGLTTVIRADQELHVVAENMLDDELYASPIVSDGKLYLRGRKNLYCIGR
jgi:outer membrane protein assembly factor BamB